MPKEKNSATSPSLSAISAARGISIIVPTMIGISTPRSAITSAATRWTISFSVVSSFTVPTSGIMTSGRASMPSFFTSQAAWKIARTCIS